MLLKGRLAFHQPMFQGLGPLQLAEIAAPATLPMQGEASQSQCRYSSGEQGPIGDAVEIGEPRRLARHSVRGERTLQQFKGALLTLNFALRHLAAPGATNPSSIWKGNSHHRTHQAVMR